MAIFRKKTEVIEAVQWTGDNLLELLEGMGLEYKYKNFTQDTDTDCLSIYITPDRTVEVMIGDWIVKGYDEYIGGFLRYTPTMFEATYEKVLPMKRYRRPAEPSLIEELENRGASDTLRFSIEKKTTRGEENV